MAKAVNLTPALRGEYEKLFNTCRIRPARAAAVEKVLSKVRGNKAIYDQASAASGVPWHFIAAVHNLESSLDFKTHLHNGDPLKQRTKNKPENRPRTGTPPFTWDFSAADALAIKGLKATTDWSLAGTLYQLERYNGWGYRNFHPHILSPYLWSFSEHYTAGKYVKDGLWSETAVSDQCGAAVLLRRMGESGDIDFKDQPTPTQNAQPLLVAFSNTKPKKVEDVQRAIELQIWLNTFPGIFVKVDGIPGNRTSEAYLKVTGHPLPGDPR